MRERGEFECLHEPFMYHYYLNCNYREMPYFEPHADHPLTYDDVRAMILTKAETSPVFFKDMGYYIDSEIINDPEFCESVTHCFLIRSPQAAIASYYQLDNEVTLAEIGLEAQWRLFCHLLDTGIQPTVIQAEDIQRDPRLIVGKWWEHIGLDANDTAFEWGDQSPEDWKQVAGWHQNTIATTSIRPRSDLDTQQEVDRFESAVNKAPHLSDYLDHHIKFYEQLKKHSI